MEVVQMNKTDIPVHQSIAPKFRREHPDRSRMAWRFGTWRDIVLTEEGKTINAEYYHVHRIFPDREAMLAFTSRCTKRRYMGRKKDSWYPADIDTEVDQKAADIASGKLVASRPIHVSLGWVSE
jgi:hypothetical protein